MFGEAAQSAAVASAGGAWPSAHANDSQGSHHYVRVRETASFAGGVPSREGLARPREARPRTTTPFAAAVAGGAECAAKLPGFPVRLCRAGETASFAGGVADRGRVWEPSQGSHHYVP
jgi:hypothetical protein